MPKTVKVRFANGVLTLLEPLDLVEWGDGSWTVWCMGYTG